MSIAVGLSGASHNACVTLATPTNILGVCEQERITRVRAAGFNSSGLPDEALDELLCRAGSRRSDVSTYAVTEAVPSLAPVRPLQLDHDYAHACAAFFPSPFKAATIIVCDEDSDQVSVWSGHGNTVTRVDWPWHGLSFAALYSRCAEILGFVGRGREQRMEALARRVPSERSERAAELFALADDRLWFAADWQSRLESWAKNYELPEKSVVAAAVQSRIGELIVEFLDRVRKGLPNQRMLCVGGSLFSNSYFNSVVKRCAGFDEVFVPVNPGNGGLSVGAALHANCGSRVPVSPFLGPCYSPEEIKATLDNCKLTYQWASDSDAIAVAVEQMMKGHLVGWFDGPMEWGARALGGRSILTSPFAPYALENLNRFLKQRAPWRGYALSGLEPSVHAHFDGPVASRFMECDYVPRDRDKFTHVLPAKNASVRVQTVDAQSPPRFRHLLEAFGQASGIPVVVNTSFNGFREPIVCSPRDAIRVFYGSGIDVLVLGQFVIAK